MPEQQFGQSPLRLSPVPQGAEQGVDAEQVGAWIESALDEARASLTAQHATMGVHIERLTLLAEHPESGRRFEQPWDANPCHLAGLVRTLCRAAETDRVSLEMRLCGRSIAAFGCPQDDQGIVLGDWVLRVKVSDIA